MRVSDGNLASEREVSLVEGRKYVVVWLMGMGMGMGM